MPQNFAEQLWALDEARYSGRTAEYEQLCALLDEAVAADPDAARSLLPDLDGCPRTKRRHQGYVLRTLIRLGL